MPGKEHFSAKDFVPHQKIRKIDSGLEKSVLSVKFTKYPTLATVLKLFKSKQMGTVGDRKRPTAILNLQEKRKARNSEVEAFTVLSKLCPLLIPRYLGTYDNKKAVGIVVEEVQGTTLEKALLNNRYSKSLLKTLIVQMREEIYALAARHRIFLDIHSMNSQNIMILEEKGIALRMVLIEPLLSKENFDAYAYIYKMFVDVLTEIEDA